VVKYVYTALGYLQQLKDNATGAVLWTANARDAEQHLIDQSAGATRTYSVYNPQTGLVQQIRASADGSDDGSLAHLDYGFDAVGNLVSRDDTIAPYTERFCYDALNRLTNYSIGGADCRSGTAGLVKSVAYDDLGNIVSKSDLATGGSGAYTYPTPGPAAVRPHAVTSIAGTVNGIAGPSYKYDGNGNLVCVYTGSGCAGGGIVRESDQVWSFNMAKTVTEGTNSAAFVYDSEHSRITQTLTAGSTVTTTTYLNDPVSGLFEERVATGGVTAWNDYLTVDGKLVAERMCTGPTPCSTGATVQDFVTDHLGSVAVVVGTSGALVARESFDVWGRERNADGTDDAPCALGSSAPTTRGFTGQEDMPAFCLLNLNARLYDPTIGRMMSADSVIPNPTDGQSFNRYTYVDNRPLSLTDPTGHEPDFQWNFEFADDPGASCFGDCGGGGGASGSIDSDASSGGMVIAHVSIALNANGTASTNISCSEGVDCGAAKNAISDKLGSVATIADATRALDTMAGRNAAGFASFAETATRTSANLAGLPSTMRLAAGAEEDSEAESVYRRLKEDKEKDDLESWKNAVVDTPIKDPNQDYPDSEPYQNVDPNADFNKRFTPDQSALIDLAKQAKRSGVTKEQADTLKDWAKELGIYTRGPEIHPERDLDFPHMHIGPINHIPVEEDTEP
jgi:RHS repeat-associated protein